MKPMASTLLRLEELSFRWADTIDGVVIQRGEDEHGAVKGYYIGKKGPWLNLDGCRSYVKRLAHKRQRRK